MVIFHSYVNLPEGSTVFHRIILKVSLALVDPETNEAEIVCESRGTRYCQPRCVAKSGEIVRAPVDRFVCPMMQQYI